MKDSDAVHDLMCVAAVQALELGLCLDVGLGSLTHPSADRVVSGDVTVIRAIEVAQRAASAGGDS
jgi:hypothetical protein